MKNLVILGAGTGGTLLANRMRRRLDGDWRITVVDRDPVHLYQPGLLMLPFDLIEEMRIVRPRVRTLGKGIDWRQSAIRDVDPGRQRVTLGDGAFLEYDFLVLASGARIRPDLTEGLLDREWRRTVFDFYTWGGARALRGALAEFERGRLVVNVVELPIKCPVAPLEFLFLADDYFTRRGLRKQIDLVYATPLDGAFTKPIASRLLGRLIDEKGIRIETDFSTGQIDTSRRLLRSYDDREIPFDLLVTVPIHSGASYVENSGLGNELAFVPTDPRTLQVRNHERIFALGDATDCPTSKAGSVAHFQGELLVENLVRAIEGKEPEPTFDGHANCFIETGHGKAVLIDFNYETEPLPGRYPFPGIGPLSLLKETRRNHWGKLAFRWIYWNALLPGRSLPIPTRMSMTGKELIAIS